MKVEIWSDVVCPWCYIGKRRFESALAEFEHRDEVEVVWRSFELDPSAPPERTGSMVDHLARKYGIDQAQAQAAQDRVTDLAELEGLRYDFAIARPGSSFDAHRLVHLAATHGRGDEMKERLLRAYFTEGRPIGDPTTLAELAAEVGLDATEVAAVLEGDDFAEAVRSDERTAGELGVSGVPFFVIDRAYGVSGAQSAEVLLDVLDQAWTAGATPGATPAG